MTLLELCEPLFQFVCRQNRTARKGGAVSMGAVRSEAKALLTDLATRAQADANLSAQFEKVELPLIFFIDSIMVESALPFAAEWDGQRIAHERQELAGDDKFFDLLEVTLKDPSDAANERLAVFYTCLGLGFEGAYKGQTDELRKMVKVIAARITKFTRMDASGRISPQAYAHVDTRNLIQPPGRKLGGLAIALAGMTVVLFITNVTLYRQASKDLRDALATITAETPTTGDTEEPETRTKAQSEDVKSSDWEDAE